MNPLRAITIRNPHAALIAAGIKRVENRGYTNSLRGEVAIHAAKQADPDADPLPDTYRQFQRFGAVIAVVDVVDCHPATPDRTGDWCCRTAGGLLTYGTRPAHHLVLQRLRVLTVPVPVRGRLQIGWTVPADVAAAVRSQLALEEVPR